MTGARFRILAVLVVALAVGFVIGTWRGGVRIETGTAHSTGDGGGSIVTDGWTYGFSSDMPWTGRDGSYRESGLPECLPPLSIVNDVRFAWVEVSVEGQAWRQVVWIDCHSVTEQSPTAVPSLTAASTTTLEPTASPGTAANWFGDVSGWELVDAPAAAQQFADLANQAVAGLGLVRVQAAALATPHNGMCCAATVTAFVVSPDPGHVETELFQAVVDGLHAGVGVDPQPACDGQAVSLAMGEQELILGPFFTGPYTIFLLADGPSIGASRAIYSDLQELGPGGCIS